jgi:hypothetical protein
MVGFLGSLTPPSIESGGAAALMVGNSEQGHLVCSVHKILPFHWLFSDAVPLALEQL